MKTFENCWGFITHSLNEIEKLSSTNAKKDLIKLFGNDSNYGDDFKIILRLTYDPYIKFYVTRVVENKNFIGSIIRDYNIHQFLSDLEKLSERRITGNAALEHVWYIHQNLYSEPNFQPYLEKILQKDLKIGIASGLINDVFSEWIPEFKLALCERFKKVNHLQGYPKIVEPKIDGVRALAFYDFREKIVEIKARSGILFENFKMIEQEIGYIGVRFAKIEKEVNMNDSPWKDGFILDGEIQDETFQGIMNSARRIHNVDCDNAIFKVWDIIPLKEFYEEKCSIDLINRKQWLETLLLHQYDNENVYDTIHMLPYTIVHVFQQVIEQFEYWHGERGEEGVIVKDPNSSYKYSSGTKRGGKNAVWWKFKIQDYAEVKGDKTLSEFSAKITGFYSGEKGTKYENVLGGFTYEFEYQILDNDTVHADDGDQDILISGNCGSGLTDEQRDDFWKRKDELIGTIMDIESQEITRNKNGQYSLRFPIFKRLRPDLLKIT